MDKKIVNKQNKWRLKKVALGLCGTCGKRKIYKYNFCRTCYSKYLDRYVVRNSIRTRERYHIDNPNSRRYMKAKSYKTVLGRLPTNS